MRHIEFCLDEITAEIVAQLDATDEARALQQLDEREARGEALTVVDAIALRRHLTEAVANHSLMRALQTVGELRWTSPEKVEGFSDSLNESEEQEWASRSRTRDA